MPPPNNPIPLDPSWRCWGCLCPMAWRIDQQPIEPRPFWANICQSCWMQLPHQWRVEFAARMTDVDKGGLGHAEFSRELLQLTEMLRRMEGNVSLAVDRLRQYLERKLGGEWDAD